MSTQQPPEPPDDDFDDLDQVEQYITDLLTPEELDRRRREVLRAAGYRTD